MTWPVRRFCSTQARFGMAIQTGLSLTEKRISVASAWRVAIATTVPFHLQWRSSPVQRSVTLKSSYMVVFSLMQPRRMGKAFVGARSFDWDKPSFEHLVGAISHSDVAHGP